MNPITRWCRVRWFRKAHSSIRGEHLADYWNDIVSDQVKKKKKQSGASTGQSAQQDTRS
jgi:hypothetical protein